MNIIVVGTDRFDGKGQICTVALATVPYHRQCAEVIELLGDFPEALAWEMAAERARQRGLAVIGPLSEDAMQT
jgi:hypothetical protein